MQDFVDQLINVAAPSGGDHSPAVIAARMFAALCAGILLAFAYRRTYTGVVFLNAIAHTQVLLSVGGSMIWLVVGDNIVRAFGLAGMIGLIRYRTRIADPKDTTILLFSMIVGMSCGLGQFVVAMIGATFVIAALVWLKLTHRAQEAEVPGTDLRALLDSDREDDDGD